MRRSQAPSVLRRHKEPFSKGNRCGEQSKENEWGSETFRNSRSSSSRQRYFSVVWRDASTRKRKVWKGDGILEVRLPTGHAVLRDDCGEYMGSVNVLHIIDELQADYQMLVHDKDIEILEEYSSEEQIMEMRQRLANNRNLDDKQQLTALELAEEKKKRKGRFLMPTYLKLKSPKLPKSFEFGIRNLNQFTSEISDKHTANETLCQPQLPSCENDIPLKFSMQEFICLVKCSELQQYLFGKVHEFYVEQLSMKLEQNLFEAFDIAGTLHMICNHPALVNQKSMQNALLNVLSSSLPDWSEMGPFDSGKLEFLQYFLQSSKDCNILIISKCNNTLNMLQGLCDFMDIKCWRLDSNAAKHQQNEVCQGYMNCSRETPQQIVLMHSNNRLDQMSFLPTMKYIIVFENVHEMADTITHEYLEQWKQLQHEIRIYYLVTAFSIEDYLLFVHLQNDNNDDGKDDIDELLDVNMTELLDMWRNSNQGAYSVLQSKTRKPLISPSTKWMVYESPFAEQFVENSDLKNCEANVDTILFKQLS